MKVKDKKAIQIKLKNLDNDNLDRVDRAFTSFQEELEKAKDPFGNLMKYMLDGIEQGATRVRVNVPNTFGDTVCLHRSCVGCRVGVCTGVHSLSCPCKNCTPWTM